MRRSTTCRTTFAPAGPKPATVNRALAAVTLMHEQAGLCIAVKRARIPRAGEPDALTTAEQGALERAAARRGARDAAIVAVLMYAGAWVEECARLEAEDVAITARTGAVRLHGKGDEVRTVPLPAIAPAPASPPGWINAAASRARCGPASAASFTDSGITQVVLAVGRDAGIIGLRPHRLRHTFATRLRQGGADPAQVLALLGHASLDTSARYFRAGSGDGSTTRRSTRARRTARRTPRPSPTGPYSWPRR